MQAAIDSGDFMPVTMANNHLPADSGIASHWRLKIAWTVAIISNGNRRLHHVLQQ